MIRALVFGADFRRAAHLRCRPIRGCNHLDACNHGLVHHLTVVRLCWTRDYNYQSLARANRVRKISAAQALAKTNSPAAPAQAD